MMARKGARAILLLSLSICCVGGCGDGRRSHVCQAIIPQERLPAGWKMLPTSEMPPSDKMPWWNHNPLLLEGSEVKQLEVEGKPSAASKVCAAIYLKNSHELVIFCFQFPTREAARAEFDLFAKSHPPEKGLLGFARAQENTFVLFSLSPDCPDRDFFVSQFEAIARQGPASQSAPGLPDQAAP